MVGLGTVGGGVAELLRAHGDAYARRGGRPLTITRAVVRDVAKARATGLLPENALSTDVDAVLGADVDVVVEVAGGVDFARGVVERALRAGKHVVTANKALLAAHGPALFALAREHGVALTFEASCGGGMPCVTALRHGLLGSEVQSLRGILNGTCNYILTQMTRHGQAYADALADAKRLGYAEADETLDVSGADAAQKLCVLASIAFDTAVAEGDVRLGGIDTLHLADVGFGAQLGYDIRLVAGAERSRAGLALSCEPAFVPVGSELANVTGSLNALRVVGNAVGPVMITGAGAGKGPTAAAVVSDLLNVAGGVAGAASDGMGVDPTARASLPIVPADDQRGRFYLRFGAADEPGVIGRATSLLGDAGISLSAVLQPEVGEDHATDAVPVVVTTHGARRGDVAAVCAQLEALDAVTGRVTVLRILD